MNEHSDEPQGQNAPAHGSSAPPPPPPRNGFFNWLRSLRIVRGRERWIGGVASGIAHRFGWDPVLVRGVFVVLAIIGGIGILAYGLGWALLPEPDGRIHTQEVGRGRWSPGMTGAVVLTIIGLWSPDVWLFDDGGLGWGIWPLLWLAGIGVLIYVIVTRSQRSKAQQQPGQSQPWSAPSPSGDGPPPTGDGPPIPPATFDPAQTQAATAMPLMTPAPYPTQPYLPVPQPPKERTGPTGAQCAIVLGLTLLTVGTITTLGYLGILTAAAAPLAAAAAVVVLGLGCIGLGLAGRRSGIIGFLSAVAIVVAQIFALVPPSPSFAVATSTQWNHTSSQLATEGYSLAAASGTIDLTGLSQPERAVTVPVNVSASDATVIVPDDTRVVITTELVFSDMNVKGPVNGNNEDIWDEQTIVLNKDAEGPPILVNIHGSFSSINIHTETNGATP
ncbi:PspC domain-containing protein [Arthrobacter roseus]|uniref:PspC domain-containing protein n=1 Tax=Arthrobacter roseus TaxID=136274 RepID=UPI00196544AB|nr:PspC domain-containing protein [Arthrobacter roseus]MBM7849352.1 phage shock protein PspC (stress-responsive transcriptional regulator) [Arthrobacter roseus]